MAAVLNEKIKSGKRFKLLIALVLTLLVVFLFPAGESIESEVQVGSVWTHDDLIASFTFKVNKDPEIYAVELKEAEKRVLPIFSKNEYAKDSMILNIRSYFKSIESSLDQNLPNNNTIFTDQTFITLKNIKKQEKFRTAKGYFSYVQLQNLIVNTIAAEYTRDVFDKKPTNPSDSIYLRIKNTDVPYTIKKYEYSGDFLRNIFKVYSDKQLPDEIKNAAFDITEKFFKASINFRQDLVDEELAQIKSNVSKISGIVNENERIVGKHERITKEIKLKIDSYRSEKALRSGSELKALQFLGKFLHISFIIALLAIYLYSFRKKIYHNNEKLLLIAFNIAFLAIMTSIISSVNINAPLQYFIFIPAASIILTIMFDSRVGFYSTVIIALITGALRGNDYSFAVCHLIAGGFSVYTVRDIKNRNQIFRSFGFILLGYVVSIISFNLERFDSIDNIAYEIGMASINAFVSPVLAYGLLIFFERIFKVTTDLTLVELSNFDNKLLRELARKAPGTFNHSMTMGTLAEAAAEEIHANALLARVGAYYHDIGKFISPQNFVENQLDEKNIHENLSPEESVALIKRHIAEGIKLAEDAGLPKEIVEFIPMHHGTTVISFFYDKARKLYGDDVDISKFRYDGPRPRSKETAIIMLADSCESAVRSIESPDAQKVENIINALIKARIEDNQLDDSDLTFSDITKIKEVFLNILLGQHHKRIRYPSQDQSELTDPTVTKNT